MANIEPLSLAIINTVHEFGKIPVGFLSRRLRRDQKEIEKQLLALQAQGAIKIEGETVSEADPASIIPSAS